MSLSHPSYDPHWASRPPGLSCASYAEGPGFTRVTVSGELDMATAPKLRDELAQAAHGSAVVILDLSELAFMDSSGLQVILTAHVRLPEADCRLVLVPGRRQVQRIFEITGAKHHLEFIRAPNTRDLATVRSG